MHLSSCCNNIWCHRACSKSVQNHLAALFELKSVDLHQTYVGSWAELDPVAQIPVWSFAGTKLAYFSYVFTIYCQINEVRIWTLFFWQGKSKLAKLEFGSWFLKYLILKGSSFWFIIFICINMHSYWLGILHNFFVIYFVALCSSSFLDWGRFDLQVFQNVLTQYFGFYVIMEVTLINNNWSMHHWNIYIFLYLYCRIYFLHILYYIILASQCIITWCRYS